MLWFHSLNQLYKSLLNKYREIKLFIKAWGKIRATVGINTKFQVVITLLNPNQLCSTRTTKTMVMEKRLNQMIVSFKAMTWLMNWAIS